MRYISWIFKTSIYYCEYETVMLFVPKEKSWVLKTFPFKRDRSQSEKQQHAGWSSLKCMPHMTFTHRTERSISWSVSWCGLASRSADLPGLLSLILWPARAITGISFGYQILIPILKLRNATFLMYPLKVLVVGFQCDILKMITKPWNTIL